MSKKIIQALQEELSQTRASLETAVAELNNEKTNSRRLGGDNATLRQEKSIEAQKVQALTLKVNELENDLTSEKNMRASAEASRDCERRLVAERTDEGLEERRLRLVAEEKLAHREATIEGLDLNLSEALRDKAEADRTIERLDRYVSLSMSRGRKA